MISLGMLLEGGPIPVTQGTSFYQGTIRDIMTVGEENYWSLMKIWDLTTAEMIPDGAVQGIENLSDFDVWKTYALAVPDFQNRVKLSVRLFFHTKIEFLPISNTIMIGEGDSLILFESYIQFVFIHVESLYLKQYSSFDSHLFVDVSKYVFSLHVIA